MKLFLIMFLFGLLIFACNNSKKRPKEKIEDHNKHKIINSSDEHPESDSSYTLLSLPDSSDLVITFSSRGEGINSKAVDILHNFIDEFEYKNNVTIEFKINKWVREGEKDYCIGLENLNNPKKELFIAEVKRLLEEINLVSIASYIASRCRLQVFKKIEFVGANSYSPLQM